MSELSTQQLVIISMYQSGWSPTAIANRLCISPGSVREFVKSPKAIAHLLEQEESTDQLVQTLYRDGARALAECLQSSSHQVRLRAAELAFKVAGKLKTDDGAQRGMNVEKFLAIITQTPVSGHEVQEVQQFFGSTSPVNELPAGDDDGIDGD